MELFWTILNTVLFILFIIVCFKAALAIRKELGFWSFLFFALCLFSLAFSKKETDNDKYFTFENGMQTQNSIKTDTIQKFLVSEHVLSDRLLSTINLRVKFKSTETNIAAISAQAYCTGFFNGTRWEPKFIDVVATDKLGVFQYKVTGTIGWTLMGFLLYSEPKYFYGTSDINS